MTPTTKEAPAIDPEVARADEGQSVIDVFIERVNEAEDLAARLADTQADSHERDALIEKIQTTADDAAAEKLASKLSTLESRLRVKQIRYEADEGRMGDAIEAARSLLGPARTEARRILDETIGENRKMAEQAFARVSGQPATHVAQDAAALLVGEIDPFARAANFQSALAGFLIHSARPLDNLRPIRDHFVEIVEALPELKKGSAAWAKAAAQFASNATSQ